MGLADQIAERNEQHFTPEDDTDEFGIPIPTPETPEYWVARALLRHQPKNPTDIYQIHLRGDDLFMGHDQLREDERTLYELTGLRHKVKMFEIVAFYEVLRKKIPKLSRRCLQVADDLYWDIERGRLVTRDEL